MLSAFVRQSDGSVDALQNLEDLAAQAAQSGVSIWADLESPTPDELRAVGAVFGLDADALDDCLAGEQRPRIDEFEGYIFIVLYGMLGVEDQDELTPLKFAAFCGARFLVTVHRQPVRTVQEVRQRCVRTPGLVIGRGVDFVLYTIIDAMVDKYVAVTEERESRVEALEEDASDLETMRDSVVTRGAALRRELIEIHRLAMSLRELLLPISDGDFDYLSASLQIRFSHVRDHLTTAIELSNALRERLHGVHENYHTTLVLRTNEIMKALTLIATLTLPLSLVTGIYGMNLQTWPGHDDPAGFWVILSVMGAFAAGMLIYFRRRGWL